MYLLCKQKIEEFFFLQFKQRKPQRGNNKKETKFLVFNSKRQKRKKKSDVSLLKCAFLVWFQSLTDRINKLLKDRKILLVNNKEEVEKLEREKVSVSMRASPLLESNQTDQIKSIFIVHNYAMDKNYKFSLTCQL